MTSRKFDDFFRAAFRGAHAPPWLAGALAKAARFLSDASPESNFDLSHWLR
jgi:hypothetical protein